MTRPTSRDIARNVVNAWIRSGPRWIIPELANDLRARITAAIELDRAASAAWQPPNVSRPPFAIPDDNPGGHDGEARS